MEVKRTRLGKKSSRQRVLEGLDKLVRKIVFATYGEACLRCGASPRPGSGGAIQAAHIYGKGAYPALRFEVWPYSNIIPLCQGKCHFGWWHSDERRRLDPNRHSECRDWCVRILGTEHMAHLAQLAIIRKGQRQNLAAVRLYLEATLKNLTD